MAHLASVPRVGRIKPNNAAVFICDIQERFAPLIHSFPSVVHTAKSILKVADILGIPCVATEQYPKGLGKTVAELDISKCKTFSKMKFSMFIPEVKSILEQNKTKSVILCGIEAHVCVQQTTLDLLENGYEVHLLADGVSSQRAGDRFVAFERLRQSGAFVTTFESVAMELIDSADHKNFKLISNILKESRPDSGLVTALVKE